ncbi:MAG: hypothetical protein JKX80_01555 [Candidatus Pacebacteria bacterium]|nr:hypothetical protein [Candidatus Paceibacterota bacterium]
MSFALFGITVGKTPKPAKLDHWEGSQGFYIRSYRRHFDAVAAKLSREDREVRVRFINELRRAEMYELGGTTIAHITVSGSEGSASEAIITLFTLEDHERAVFQEEIPLRVRFIEEKESENGNS